jgi:hypothetical protein
MRGGWRVSGRRVVSNDKDGRGGTNGVGACGVCGGRDVLDEGLGVSCVGAGLPEEVFEFGGREAALGGALGHAGLDHVERPVPHL